jgi:hypothetical protein
MLSDTQKAQVRFVLGQSSIHRYLNPRLEGIWGALDTDAEVLVAQILAQLAVHDARLLGTGSEVGFAAKAAGVKSLEEIAFAGNGGAVDLNLRRICRMLVGRLSSLLGVPIYADIYSSAGWPGDSYSANGLAGGGGTNTFGLG